jgi:ATP-binding protein involved in chromosome partitioning
VNLTDIPTRVIVASGKGGVGKTTVSSDIARTARDMGYSVGLIDADISTPNSPQVIGGEGVDLEGQRLSNHDSLVPPVIDGIQVISQGVVLPDDVPVLRDGGWRAEAVADYIEFVEWQEQTDVLVIDTPPGTGEELQVVTSAAEPDHAYVVTTPHPSSVRDAEKTHQFFTQAEVPHSGVLNMAYMPSGDVVDAVLSEPDLTALDGVGEATAESVRELVEETTVDVPLFGYDPGEDVALDMDFVATLPYSVDYAQRSPRIEAVVDHAVGTEELVQ